MTRDQVGRAVIVVGVIVAAVAVYAVGVIIGHEAGAPHLWPCGILAFVAVGMVVVVGQLLHDAVTLIWGWIKDG